MNCGAVVGTNRGEADGFALDILSKLKDVKSKVSVGLQHCHHCGSIMHHIEILTLICYCTVSH